MATQLKWCCIPCKCRNKSHSTASTNEVEDNQRQVEFTTNTSDTTSGSNASKVDINQRDNEGRSSLHRALLDGASLHVIQNLIGQGADLQMKDKSKEGALHFAVRGGDKEVIQHLISKGIHVNATNEHGSTPLHLVLHAKLKNHFEMTKLLLDNGANLYSKDNWHNTIAHLMLTCEDVSCDDFKTWAIAMIKNGHAQVFNMKGGLLGFTPLHYWMEKHDLDLETLKLIVEFVKTDINQPDDDGDTILHLALRFGKSLDTIRTLVELGADWKKRGMDDWSVMHFAVMVSDKEVFLYFKSLGADVNATDGYGQTPLHHVPSTKSRDFLGMTKFLLEHGANPIAKDEDGETLDQFMRSDEDISAGEYRAWKEGMIQLGYADLFQKK